MKSSHSQWTDKDHRSGTLREHKDFPMNELAEVAKLYNLEFKTIHSEINIEGSPERTDFRIVFEDKQGMLFIIEQLLPQTVSIKNRIAHSLAFLKKNYLERIQPYIRNLNKEYITKHKSQFWQIVPYIPGIKLQRPEYVYDSWRGALFADFLIQLHLKSQNILFFKKKDVFSIKNYIYSLMKTIKKNKPIIFSRFQPILAFLEKKYFEACDTLPIALCHGDFHPLNMIWSNTDINGVIDWEFMGYKTEIYDVANMIGCIGIEDPNSLTGDLVVTLIRELKKSHIISDTSWDYLLESIIAQRFGWLSEWLRKNDLEMQEMEEDYLKLLIEKQDVIKTCWTSLNPSADACIYV